MQQCSEERERYRCIYVEGHGGEHFAPQDGRDHSEEIRVRVLLDRVAKLERENASLQNQCGDNLCWAQSPAEIKALPEAQHLESCRRYWNQVSSERGVFAGGKTIAQLEQECGLLRKALKPFAECERLWMEEGKRAEIRMDWLTAAREALAEII